MAHTSYPALPATTRYLNAQLNHPLATAETAEHYCVWDPRAELNGVSLGAELTLFMQRCYMVSGQTPPTSLGLQLDTVEYYYDEDADAGIAPGFLFYLAYPTASTAGVAYNLFYVGTYPWKSRVEQLYQPHPGCPQKALPDIIVPEPILELLGGAAEFISIQTLH